VAAAAAAAPLSRPQKIGEFAEAVTPGPRLYNVFVGILSKNSLEGSAPLGSVSLSHIMFKAASDALNSAPLALNAPPMASWDMTRGHVQSFQLVAGAKYGSNARYTVSGIYAYFLMFRSVLIFM
jgi:hypothetical protein